MSKRLMMIYAADCLCNPPPIHKKGSIMQEIKRGEIYYACFDNAVGSEQSGLRPVVIIQNDKGNRYSPTTIVAAITSNTDKPRLPTHVPIQCYGLHTDSLILAEQVRTIDKNRLQDYVGTLDQFYIEKMDKALSISFGLSHQRRIT